MARGLWRGTITIALNGASTYVEPPNVISSSTTHTVLKHQVTLTLAQGQATAKVEYELKESTSLRDDYDSNVVTGSIDTLTTVAQSGVPARVGVELYEDGTYELQFSADAVIGQWAKQETSHVRCKPKVDPECRDSDTSHSDSGPAGTVGYVADYVREAIDKANPGKLSGSITTPYQYAEGFTGTRAITWTLAR